MRTTLPAIVLLTAALAAAHAQPAAGTDFGPQARVLFRVAACGGDDAIPARFSARAINLHCKEMAEIYGSYRKAWADEAKSFIASLRPKDLPKAVVYPFGGGDLSSALAVYPDATELTTISLEAAGDVRAIDTIKSARLDEEVDAIGTEIRRLYRSAHSTTKSLQAASHSELPGTLMFALAGLAVHGMEPVALRYFDIEPGGQLSYLSNAQLDERAAEFAAKKLGTAPPRKITHYWYEQVSAFANVEIQFRPRGDAAAPLRTYRHIVANLDDSHMAADDRVLRHLRGKGKVSVMTKAASFLLWYDDFSKIRDYLLRNTAWMISDASGIPPSYAGPAGFEQITYGEFTGPYFVIDDKNTRAEFVKLWKSQPHRDLPFRFGYPDAAKHNHLMIMRLRTGAAPGPSAAKQ
ncbi:MAG: hypothetical protein E6J90_24660 [Deltaproteobacteria bacterium]|nr:MAG: hypothetical protein E6J90_24660 [Deltaproteobacteria bacterium]TMQ17779.1 MAG: hypothetical protein E6J91_09350 [Deltaproteobacteria bacterium]